MTAPPLPLSRVAAASATAALAATVLYVLRAGPTTYLLDSSELVASTAALAVSHPPGHPAYHLIGFVPSLLPFGTAAFRAHVFGAITIASVIGLLPVIAWRFGWLTRSVHGFLAAILSAGAAWMHGLLFQAIRAEVYGLHALVVLLALAVLARPPGSRLQLRETALLAAILGVGLANHHYLTVFTFPAFLAGVLCYAPVGARVRHLLVGCGFGVVPLAAYAYLPLRAAAQPAIGWGWPASIADVFWTVSAAAFQKTAGNAVGLDVAGGLVNVLGVLADQVTILGVFLAVAALTLLALRDRRAALVIALAVLANLATQTLFAFDPTNPDVLGYFMTSAALLVVLTIYGATALASAAPNARLRDSAVVVAALGFAWSIATLGGSAERTRTLAAHWDADALRDAAWHAPGPDALLVTAYFETQFNAWYGIAVEDRRPDMLHVHRGFRTYPFYDAMLTTQSPAALPLLTPDAGRGLLDPIALMAWSREAPVWLEPEILFEVELLPRMLPAGLMLELHSGDLPSGQLPGPLRLEHLETLERLQGALVQPLELQTRRNLLWSTYQLARHLCDAGRVIHCSTLADAAAILAPGDASVEALRGRARALRETNAP